MVEEKRRKKRWELVETCESFALFSATILNNRAQPVTASYDVFLSDGMKHHASNAGLDSTRPYYALECHLSRARP